MNHDLGHPNFLGIYEQVTTSGFSSLSSSEEEEKSSIGGKGVLDWSSTASNPNPNTQEAQEGEWDWSDYDPGPDGIPGTLDDVGGPQPGVHNLPAFHDWYENWYLPWSVTSGTAFVNTITSKNTISNMGGQYGSGGHQLDSLVNRFILAVQFSVIEWDMWDAFQSTYGYLYPE